MVRLPDLRSAAGGFKSRPPYRRSLVLAFGEAMASAVARAYNGGLGAVPPAGSRGRAPGQGVWGAKPPRS